MNIIKNQSLQLVVQFDAQEQSTLCALSDTTESGHHQPPAIIEAAVELLNAALSELIDEGRVQQKLVNIHNLARFFTDKDHSQHWFNKSYLALTNKRVNCFTNEEYSFGFNWTYQLQAEALEKDYQLLLEHIIASITDQAISLSQKIGDKRLYIRASVETLLASKVMDLNSFISFVLKIQVCQGDVYRLVDTLRKLSDVYGIELDISDGNPNGWDHALFAACTKITPLEMYVAGRTAHADKQYMPLFKQSLIRQAKRSCILYNPYFNYMMGTQQDVNTHPELILFQATNNFCSYENEASNLYQVESVYEENQPRLHQDLLAVRQIWLEKYDKGACFELDQLTWMLHFAKIDMAFAKPWFVETVAMLQERYVLLPFTFSNEVEVKVPSSNSEEGEGDLQCGISHMPYQPKENERYLKVVQGVLETQEVFSLLEQGQYSEQDLLELVSRWQLYGPSEEYKCWIYTNAKQSLPEWDENVESHRIPVLLFLIRALFLCYPSTKNDEELFECYVHDASLVNENNPFFKEFLLNNELEQAILNRIKIRNETVKYISNTIQVFEIEKPVYILPAKGLEEKIENKNPDGPIYYRIEFSDLQQDDVSIEDAVFEEYHRRSTLHAIQYSLLTDIDDLPGDKSRFDILIKANNRDITGTHYLGHIVAKGWESELAQLFEGVVYFTENNQPILDPLGSPIFFAQVAEYACKDESRIELFIRYLNAVDVQSSRNIQYAIHKVISSWPFIDSNIELIAILLTSAKTDFSFPVALQYKLSNDIKEDYGLGLQLVTQMVWQDSKKPITQASFNESLELLMSLEEAKNCFDQACSKLLAENPEFTTDKQFEKSWSGQTLEVDVGLETKGDNEINEYNDDYEDRSSKLSIDDIVKNIEAEEIPLLQELKIENREVIFTFSYPGESLATDEVKYKSQHSIRIIRSFCLLVRNFFPDVLNDAHDIHNVQLCIQQSDGRLLLEEDFFEELKSLCATSKKLRVCMEDYIRTVAEYQQKHWQVWINDENGMAMYAAGVLACANKGHMKTLIVLLESMDLSHEVSSTDWIGSVVDRWGYCPETYYLLAARATLVQGQYALEGLDDDLTMHFDKRPKEFEKYLISTKEMAKDFFMGEGQEICVNAITDVLADEVLSNMYLTDLIIEFKQLGIKTTYHESCIHTFTYTSNEEPNEETYGCFLEDITPRLLSDIQLAFITSKRNTLYLNARVEFQQYKWTMAEFIARAVKYPSCKKAINDFLTRISLFLERENKNVFCRLPKAIINQNNETVSYSYRPIMMEWIEPIINVHESYLISYQELVEHESEKPFYIDSSVLEDVVSHYGVTDRTLALVKLFLANTPYPDGYQKLVWNRADQDHELMLKLFANLNIHIELESEISTTLLKKYHARDFGLVDREETTITDNDITAFLFEAVKSIEIA